MLPVAWLPPLLLIFATLPMPGNQNSQGHKSDPSRLMGSPLLRRYYLLLGVAAFSLSYFLLHTGVVGNWKELFSKAQNEEMDQKFEDCLGGTKLAAKMKYDVYCKA